MGNIEDHLITIENIDVIDGKSSLNLRPSSIEKIPEGTGMYILYIYIYIS